MKFRTTILFIEDTSPVTCGGNLISESGQDVGLGIIVKVGGTQIVSITDFSIYTGTTTVAVPNIGNVTFEKLDNTGIDMTIPLTNVWDSTTVEITASKVHFNTYNQIFTVFGYDLGDDQFGQPYVQPDMNIVLSPTQLVASSYNKFVAYRAPFTNKIYFYNLVSEQHNIYVDNYKYTYSDNTSGTIIQQGIMGYGFYCNAATNILKLKREVGTYVNNIFVTTTYCEATLQIVEYANLKPPYSIKTNCTTCDDSCVLINDGALAYTLFGTDIQKFLVDDVEVAPYPSMDLTYDLYDLSGQLVATQTYEVTTDYPFVPSVANYPFTDYTLPDTGDYVLKVTLSVDDLFSCVDSMAIKGCGDLTITKANCSEYTFTNITLEDVTVTIYKITSSDSLAIEDNTIIVDEEVVIFNGTYSKTLEDGLYAIKIVRGDKITLQYLPVYCKLETCLASYVKNIACASPPSCSCGGSCGKSCQKVDSNTYNINALMAIAYTYFAIINTNVFLNKIFNGTEANVMYPNFPKDIAALFSLQTLLDKALNYCEVCNLSVNRGSYSVSSNAHTIKSSKGGCGCS